MTAVVFYDLIELHCLKKPLQRCYFFRGIADGIRTIYLFRGLSGFLRGIQARVLFQVPSTALSWSVYEFFKYILSLDEKSA